MMLQIFIISFCTASVSALSEEANRPSRNMLSQRAGDALGTPPPSSSDNGMRVTDGKMDPSFARRNSEKLPMVRYLDRKLSIKIRKSDQKEIFQQ